MKKAISLFFALMIPYETLAADILTDEHRLRNNTVEVIREKEAETQAKQLIDKLELTTRERYEFSTLTFFPFSQPRGSRLYYDGTFVCFQDIKQKYSLTPIEEENIFEELKKIDAQLWAANYKPSREEIEPFYRGGILEKIKEFKIAQKILEQDTTDLSIEILAKRLAIFELISLGLSH